MESCSYWSTNIFNTHICLTKHIICIRVWPQIYEHCQLDLHLVHTNSTLSPVAVAPARLVALRFCFGSKSCQNIYLEWLIGNNGKPKCDLQSMRSVYASPTLLRDNVKGRHIMSLKTSKHVWHNIMLTHETHAHSCASLDCRRIDCRRMFRAMIYMPTKKFPIQKWGSSPPELVFDVDFKWCKFNWTHHVSTWS